MGNIEKIAKERIDILFREAKKRAKQGDMALAHRYVELARKIGMRCNVKIPRKYKRKFCKHCYKYLRPGLNCIQRIKKDMITITCKECGKKMKYPTRSKGYG